VLPLTAATDRVAAGASGGNVTRLLIAAVTAALGVALSLLTTGPAAAATSYPNATCLRLVPPAYGPSVLTGTQSRGSVPANIIANWGSTTVNKLGGGPGQAYNAQDAASIAAERRAGVQVLGYVATWFGHVSAWQIEAQVRQWRNWYGVRDIFLDNGPGHGRIPAVYGRVYAWIHRYSKAAQVWMNCAVWPSSAVMRDADVINVFEGAYDATPYNLVGVQPPAWARHYPASRFALIVYNTSRREMGHALALIRSDHGGHAYVTDGNGISGSPYAALPSYWRAEVSAAKARG
jgi:Spherulation-specific family 4